MDLLEGISPATDGSSLDTAAHGFDRYPLPPRPMASYRINSLRLGFAPACINQPQHLIITLYRRIVQRCVSVVMVQGPLIDTAVTKKGSSNPFAGS